MNLYKDEVDFLSSLEMYAYEITFKSLSMLTLNDIFKLY